jgi:DNA repair exonuclease SbcCD ATPase subunit
MAQEITSLTVRNYKGVKGEITLNPEGKSLVVIAGANGSGKSSFIDAITEIFDPKGTRITSRPIHDGAEEASAELTTDQARLLRTWKKNDAGTLNAYALDGAKYPSGKDFVLKATGGAIFDASEFVSMDAKAQREELLAKVELPFDLAELDAKRAGYFDGRTDVTRDVKALTAQLAGFPPVDETIPQEEVSAAAILAEHEKARQHNAAVDQLVQSAIAVEDERLRAESTVARLTDELDAAQTYLLRAKETETEIVTKTKAARTIDTDEIAARLSSIEGTNAKVRAQAARTAVAAKLAAETAKAADLTAKLEAIDAQKAAGLKAAKFPVQGLSVDDDGITFDGVPFRQVNTAKKVEIAFDLMTQSKPDLRLVMIKDGDALDADTLAGIDKVASARGYIVLVERDRDDSREIGFTIVEGQLA